MLRRLALALAGLAGLVAPALAQNAVPVVAYDSRNPAYNSATRLVPGQTYSPFPSWRAACSSAGYLRLITINGDNYDIYASVGTGGEDGIGIVGIAATGSTPAPVASCIVTALTRTDR